MKITDVKATVLKTRSIIVQIYTDEGVTGSGECSPLNPGVISHFVNTALKPLLIGENPLEIDKLWNKMTLPNRQSGR